MNQTAQPLTAEQLRRLQLAIATVINSGWGQVSLVIIKGRVVGLKTEVNESFN
jgi:hypothetical protein